MRSLLATLMLVGCSGGSPTDDTAPVVGEACAEPQAVMDAYCVQCHSQSSATAGLSLTQIGTVVDVASSQSTLPLITAGSPDDSYLVHKMLGTHGVVGGTGSAMPPPGFDAVPESDSQVFTDWIAAGASCDTQPIDDDLDPLPPWEPVGAPGYVVLRRLNADMVDRTLSDLLLIESHEARARFSGEGEAFGFDNNAGAVNMSLGHIETAEATIDAVLDIALVPPVTIESYRWEMEDPIFSGTGTEVHYGAYPDWYYGIRWYFTATRGGPIQVPYDGEYSFNFASCGQDDAEGNLPELQLLLDGSPTATMVVDDIECTDPTEYMLTDPIYLTAGEHNIELGLANDPTNDDMRLSVDWFQFTGPLDATGTAEPSRANIFVCDPAIDDIDDTDQGDCARDIIEAFLPRAWRRPVTEAEIDSILAMYTESRDSGGDFDEGIRLALKLALLSPHFLFVVELDPDTTDTDPHALNGYEMANRLSYFLWSSMPDDELMAAAEDGSLLTDEGIEAQVNRMLLDPRAQSLVDNLAGQWWGMRLLLGEHTNPDEATFPTFSETLREAMHEEMRLFSEQILLGDRPMSDVLTASDHYVDDELATLYGVTAPSTPFAPTPTTDHEEMGLTGLAGWLTATSKPERTSPVVRGDWVLSNLLCEEPPPPPDDVITVIGEGDNPSSMREQLELHRANPVCASCHDAIDPIGLAYEGFDGIGQARESDAWGNPVDPSGELLGLGEYSNAAEMVGLLEGDPRVGRCMVQKTFIYALGRGTGPHDVPTIQDIEASYLANGGTFAELAVQIALSDAFRMEGPQ